MKYCFVLLFASLIGDAYAFMNHPQYVAIVGKYASVLSAKAWKEATEELGKKRASPKKRTPPKIKEAPRKISNKAWKNAVEQPDESVGASKKSQSSQQQKAAVALFLGACLFDFFVTHHGVGPWDPNYVL
jgi:hypothetical protein